MGEVDMFRAFDALLVDGPQARLLLRGLLRQNDGRDESACEEYGC
jgi:hypothetical protein